MKLLRLFIDAPLLQNTIHCIADADFHYLTKVMRKAEGDKIYVFNGDDGEWLAEIKFVDKKQAQLEVLNQVKEAIIENPLKLIFAPIKNPDASWIVTKATELGVTEIQPVLTSRSVVTKVNLEKMLHAAKEATEQCERLGMPKMNNIISFSEAMSNHDGEIIFFDETGSGISAKDALNRSFKNPAIVIGPEGGFDPKELNLVKSKTSCILVSLGKRILRSETAIIAALSLYQGYLGDW